jgi:hypothetical protein
VELISAQVKRDEYRSRAVPVAGKPSASRSGTLQPAVPIRSSAMPRQRLGNSTRQKLVSAPSTPKSLSLTSSSSVGDRIAMPSRSAATSG